MSTIFNCGLNFFKWCSSCKNINADCELSLPTAHWLQWEACKSPDVHRDRGWPLSEAARFLPGSPHHRKNRRYSKPGNYHYQHKGSGDSSSSWKQHVCQVVLWHQSDFLRPLKWLILSDIVRMKAANYLFMYLPFNIFKLTQDMKKHFKIISRLIYVSFSFLLFYHFSALNFQFMFFSSFQFLF